MHNNLSKRWKHSIVAIRWCGRNLHKWWRAKLVQIGRVSRNVGSTNIAVSGVRSKVSLWHTNSMKIKVCHQRSAVAGSTPTFAEEEQGAVLCAWGQRTNVSR